MDALLRRKAGRSQEGSRIRPWDFWFSILDLLLRLEAGAELASGELEYVQEPEQAEVEQRPRSSTSSLGLPPPVLMGEELDFGRAVGSEKQQLNAGRTSNPNAVSGGDNTNRVG